MQDFPGAALTADDTQLIEAARDVLRRLYRPHWHMVAAALRGRDGRVWTGIHLGATVGRLQTCAEAVALGRAVLEGDGRIACAVAVRHPKPGEADQSLAVVPPCGGCREMLFDFDAESETIIPVAGGLRRVRIASLLPFPYQR